MAQATGVRSRVGCRLRRAGWLPALLVAAWLFGPTEAASAASFTLQDGRRLDGEVVQATRNTVMLRGTAGGIYQLALGQVRSVEVTTQKGEKISGRLSAWAKGVYEIETGERIVRFANGEVLAEGPISLPKLSVESASAPESAAEIVFQLTLSRPAEMPILIIYATFDGTAEAGRDYQAAKGAVSLPAGSVKTEIKVPLINDDQAEADETFELFVAVDKKLATIEAERVVGTILNDD